MQAGTLVSLSEYLSTSYEPDCDYVDGVLEERNVGENDHAYLQGEIFYYFRSRSKRWGVYAAVEQRVQVSASRFRVPDVCVMLGGRPKDPIFTAPPFICIEILSPKDRLSRVRVRINDYLNFGVPYVFLLDPETREAFRCTREGILKVQELRTENPEIVIPMADFFEGA